MFYLISQYFWWLVVALAFGLIVGWITSERNPDRRLGWLWPVLVGAAVALLVTWLRFVNGVPALWIETALLFLGVYVVGCLIGSVLKSTFTSEGVTAGGVREWNRNLGAAGPGIMAGSVPGGVREWNRDLGQAAPAAAPAPVPVEASPATPVALAQPVAAADPQLMPAVEGEDAIAGQRPVGFVSPRGGKADDLKLIRGIGRQNEGRLHGLGIWHFDQIAAWTRENIDWVGSYLAFPGRIDREEWVKQARILASGKETEFAKRVKGGQVATSQDDGSLGQGNVEKLEPLTAKPGVPPRPDTPRS